MKVQNRILNQIIISIYVRVCMCMCMWIPNWCYYWKSWFEMLFLLQSICIYQLSGRFRKFNLFRVIWRVGFMEMVKNDDHNAIKVSWRIFSLPFIISMIIPMMGMMMRMMRMSMRMKIRMVMVMRIKMMGDKIEK